MERSFLERSITCTKSRSKWFHGYLKLIERSRTVWSHTERNQRRSTVDETVHAFKPSSYDSPTRNENQMDLHRADCLQSDVHHEGASV